MFTTDRPIESIEEDVLKRSSFSKQLAKAILSYSKKDNFVISLCGKWGCGKTSILNMVLEEIEKLTEQGSYEEKPIIVNFNPWNYSDCNQLINQFFAEIISSLNIKDRSESLKKVGDAIKGYSSLFEYTQFIPGAGPFIAPLKSTIDTTGEFLSKKGEEIGSLTAKKKVVKEALANQKQKIIIVIDDLDRLNNQQIRAIFQLVNSVAGFPNMIYLLSFDREVVARALQTEQNCNGDEYLEKIIQVQFDVPEVSQDLITDYFVIKFLSLVDKESFSRLDGKHWQLVLNHCVTPYLKNIRDAKRILNSFEFSFDLMKGEIDVADLLALTTLHICAPEIYKWIFFNKNILVGGQKSFYGLSGDDQKKNEEKFIEIFREINPKYPERMMDIIQVLFPRFLWETGSYNLKNCTEAELRKRNSIASSDKFGRYFDLSLETIPIKQSEVYDSIMTYTRVQLETYLIFLLNDKKLNYYLNELLSHLEEIPKERIRLFIFVLAKIQENSKMREKPNYLIPSPFYSCDTVIRNLFKMNEEGNADIIMEMIQKANSSGLIVLTDIIETLIEAWDENNQFAEKEDRFVSKEDLGNIERAFSERIEKVVDNLFSEDYQDKLYKLWGELNKENRDAHIINLMDDGINIPSMLLHCANRWSSNDGKSSWSFGEKYFEKYISAEKAYKGIINLKNDRFSELTDEGKNIAIAYVNWYESGQNESDEIEYDFNQDLFELQIKEWEKKE